MATLSLLNWFLLASVAVGLGALALRVRAEGRGPEWHDLGSTVASAPKAGERKRGRAFLVGALLVYALVVLVGIERFPIYFFADEAAQTVHAARLVEGDWRIDGRLLPTYFYNVDKFSLSVSVYWQVLPYVLFGKCVWATRAAAALATLPLALGLALLLRNVFRSPYWWSATLLLPLAPAWFIHARTAFEPTMASSFLVLALYCYLRYLRDSPRYLYPALILAALAFYSYNPMRMTVCGLVLLLALIDWRHHARHEGVAMRGWWLLVFMTSPYLRFRLAEPGTELAHLDLIQSHWLLDAPLTHKLYVASVGYSHALNPAYWFLPNQYDIIRHTLPGAGHLPLAMLPLTLVGLAIALRRWRDPAWRALLVTLALAPAAGLVALPLVTRVLAVLPLLVALAAIGFGWLLGALEGARMGRRELALLSFCILAVANLMQLRSALVDGPTAYDDYGLHGLQYGGRQFFGAARDLLEEADGARIAVDVDWLNGPAVLQEFFVPDGAPVEWDSILYYLFEDTTWDERTIWLMPAAEFHVAAASPFVGEIEVLREIPLPDGRPGFYAARLERHDRSDG